MASERPLPAHPNDPHDAPQTDAPSAPTPTAAPTSPRSQEGDRSGPSQGNPFPRNAYSNIPTDHYPYPSSSAYPTSPTSFHQYDGDGPYRGVADFTTSQPSTPFGANLPVRPSSARFSDPLEHSTTRRRNTKDTRDSILNHVVPVVETNEPPSNLRKRLEPTITAAKEERAKYAWRAKWTRWALNIAIGLQVLLGSLTTGISAATSNPRSAAVQTTVLGAFATLVASYLARARGSNEPAFSTTRLKDLDRFIRDCEAFELDNGNDITDRFDHDLTEKRKQLERILGSQTASSSEKQAPSTEKTEPKSDRPPVMERKLADPSPV